jgi:peroxiredoxin
MPDYIRYILFILLLTTTLSVIGLIFYEQEIQFLLPTPKPEHIEEKHIGEQVHLDGLDFTRGPYFIHFYNSDCPCSRFNIKDFRSMVRKHQDEIRFVAVLETDDKSSDEIVQFQKKYDLGIPILQDSNGKLAKALGVYSTPQAVLVGRDSTIYYKGNYNRSRFCSSNATAFANLALTCFLEEKPLPVMPEVALIPYGCSLPSNKDNDGSTLVSWLGSLKSKIL